MKLSLSDSDIKAMGAGQSQLDAKIATYTQSGGAGTTALDQAEAVAIMLEKADIRRYQNRAVKTAQVIEELIALAKEMRAANARRQRPQRKVRPLGGRVGLLRRAWGQ
jgi:hypothetical protein